MQDGQSASRQKKQSCVEVNLKKKSLDDLSIPKGKPLKKCDLHYKYRLRALRFLSPTRLYWSWKARHQHFTQYIVLRLLSLLCLNAWFKQTM